MVTNEKIIAYIAKHGVDVDTAIAACEVEARSQSVSKEEDIIKGCLSDDREVAQKSWDEYVADEKRSEQTLVALAKEDYAQAVREMEQKMKSRIRKGETYEQAQAAVFLKNPMLFEAYSRSYNILVTRGAA